ncbi:hypothetical protein BD560DRAFT_486870, partial [Blakeslea trispora]
MVPTSRSIKFGLLIPRRLGRMITNGRELFLYHVLLECGNFCVVLITPELLNNVLPHFNQPTQPREGARVNIYGLLNQAALTFSCNPEIEIDALFVDEMDVLTSQVPISDRIWFLQNDTEQQLTRWNESQETQDHFVLLPPTDESSNSTTRNDSPTAGPSNPPLRMVSSTAGFFDSPRRRRSPSDDKENKEFQVIEEEPFSILDDRPSPSPTFVETADADADAAAVFDPAVHFSSPSVNNPTDSTSVHPLSPTETNVASLPESTETHIAPSINPSSLLRTRSQRELRPESQELICSSHAQTIPIVITVRTMIHSDHPLVLEEVQEEAERSQVAERPERSEVVERAEETEETEETVKAKKAEKGKRAGKSDESAPRRSQRIANMNKRKNEQKQ